MKNIMVHLKRHYIIYSLTLVMLVGFWIVNISITLPFQGVLYWDYARHFQFSYVDSPYMLPLFIKVYSLIFGAGPLAFGYINFLFFTLTVMLIYFIVVTIHSRKIAIITVLMYLALPIQFKFLGHLDYHLGVILMFSFVLLFLTRWQVSEKKRYLYLTAVCLGMMLMMQFESVFLTGSLVLASFCVKEYRVLWRMKAFYYSLILTLLIVLPFLVWQIQHNWLTIHFLHSSNNTAVAFSFQGFISAILDYIGSVGLFLVLLVGVFIRMKQRKIVDPTSLYFIYLFIFITLSLNLFFMYSPRVRHVMLINADIVLLLFLSYMSFSLFPRLTWVITFLSLIGSLIYFVLVSIVLYHQFNDLSFQSIIQPMLTKNTIVISDLKPKDNAPSFVSIELKGQPEVYALPDVPPSYDHNSNPAVYLWQPTLDKLMANKTGYPVLVLTNQSLLPASLSSYVTCHQPLPLSITVKTVDSIKQLLEKGFYPLKVQIYAHQCTVK